MEYIDPNELEFISNIGIFNICIIHIGCGALSKVYLVKSKVTKLTYAVKCISKRNLIKYNLINQIYNGLKCLTAVSHFSIARLISFWQDSTNLYLLSEYIAGGELFSLIKKTHGLTLESTHFYICQIIKFFSKLHSKNIVYRDLKPENILISNNGYIKIIDFDYAKEINENKTYTFVGTPEYMAPEIIRLTGHNIMSDYWSLGVLIYECLTGISPFLNEDPIYLYENILNCKYQLPKGMDNNAKDLIRKLFNLNPKTRMGGISQCFCNIKSHPFMTSITYNTKDFNCQVIKAPFIPEIEDNMDHRNFVSINTKIPDDEDNEDISADIDEEEDDRFKMFEEFNTNLTSST